MIFMCLGKICGAIYKLPLTSILGASGIGMYQLVFPIFVTIVMVSSQGTSLAVTKLVADGKMNYKKVFFEGIKLTLILSVCLSLLIIVFSRQISNIQGNENIYPLYYYVAILIVFVSVLSVYRGLFRGFQNIKIYAISEFIEQLGKLVFGLIFAVLFVKKGVLNGVIGAFIGIIFASIISLFYLIILSKKYRENKSGLLLNKKLFYNYTIFGSFSSIITPISQFIDSIIIINLLNKIGLSEESSTSNFGLLVGACSTITNLPLSLILAITTVALPSLSASNGEQKFKKTQEFLLYTFLITSVSSIVLFLFSNEIVSALYGSLSYYHQEICTFLIKITSIGVFFAGMSEMCLCIFQSDGKFYIGLISLIIGNLIKTILLICFIPKYGIYGAAYAFTFGYSATAVVSYLWMRLRGEIGGNKVLYKALIYLVIFGNIAFLLKRFLSLTMLNLYIYLLVVGIALITLFAFMTFLIINPKMLKFVLKKK